MPKINPTQALQTQSSRKLFQKQYEILTKAEDNLHLE